MKYILCVLLLLCAFNVFSQKNKSKILGYLLYDKDGSSVKDLDKAYTYEVITEFNDSTFIVRNYLKNGPMIWQQTFKDKDLSVANGRFVWYNENGDIDSTGIAVNGHKDGVWNVYAHIPFDDKDHLVTERDSIIEVKYYNLGKQISKQEYFNDTTENSAIKRSFFKGGKPITELEFNTDATGKREAEFPKGSEGWRNYLMKNLNGNAGLMIPQYGNLKNNRAVVTISFLVGKDGSVYDVFVLNSSGYPFDMEAIRVIENSGKWIPAQYDGRIVTYRQRQRIIFR